MERIERYYSMIANKANEIVPVEWNRIILYSELDIGTISYYFGFFEKSSGNWVDFYGVPVKYGIDRSCFRNSQRELVKIIQDFYDESTKVIPNIWTTMTFILEANGKFKIDYGYEDLLETNELVRREQFEQKYLNL